MKQTKKQRQAAYAKLKGKKSDTDIMYERFNQIVRSEFPNADKVSKSEFLTLRAAEKAKGRDYSIKELARYYGHYGYTEKEIRARWNAEKRLNKPTMSRKQYINNALFLEFDAFVEEQADLYRSTHEGATSAEVAAFISATIYGSE